MSEHKSIAEAQLAVMRDVTYIQKQHSKELGYAIIPEPELIAKVRPAMVEHGITVHPTACEPVVAESLYESKNGGRMVNRLFRFTFRFSHAASGTYHDVVTLGEASDSADRAAKKAMTSAFKYAIRQFFALESGDDPDVVVHHRAASNAHLIARIASAIRSAREPDKLKQIAEKFREPHLGLTAEQLNDLERFYQEQLAKLERRP